MRVLIIGGGGREHAIAWRLAKSTSVKELVAVPGNPGIARVGRCIQAPTADPSALAELAASLAVDLTVVGPEAPLVAGAVDAFRARGLAIVGPTAAAAQLEGSKVFAKEFMERAGIPTAGFARVENETEAIDAIDRFGCPVVLKADGLAAGKGVIIAIDRAEAVSTARRLLAGEIVGAAGNRLVVEEFLTGEEVSFIVVTDGAGIAVLEPTQDHKAVGDGDTGPNTGGMGAYCDSRILTGEQRRSILDTIVNPVLDHMRFEGNPFTGFLYVGLMMTAAGPKVLEFNVRMGDPETQAIMHRMSGDFGEVLAAAARGSLEDARLDWNGDPSVCVVMSSAGYPGEYRTGVPIHGLEEAENTGATVFHAGTRQGAGGIETAGGRVLGVTASGRTLGDAIKNAYAGVARISFDGAYYRHDIGSKGLARWR